MCCEGGCGGGVPGSECACGVLCGRVRDRREGGIRARQGCVGWGVCLGGVLCACVRLGVRGRGAWRRWGGRFTPCASAEACWWALGVFFATLLFVCVSRLPHRRCIWSVLCISIDSRCIPCAMTCKFKFSHSYRAHLARSREELMP